MHRVPADWSRFSSQDRTQCRDGTKNWSPGPRTGSRGPTTSRRLLRIDHRTEDRFEAINGNSICPGTNFQGEKFILGTENSVGSRVQLRERLDNGVLVKKGKLSRGQSCRHTS